MSDCPVCERPDFRCECAGHEIAELRARVQELGAERTDLDQRWTSKFTACADQRDEALCRVRELEEVLTRIRVNTLTRVQSVDEALARLSRIHDDAEAALSDSKGERDRCPGNRPCEYCDNGLPHPVDPVRGDWSIS